MKKTKTTKKVKTSKIPTIYVGKEVINLMITRIALPKGDVGKKIGLSPGGFHKVTHVTGRINIECWDELKKLYFSKGFTQLPSINASSDKKSDSKKNEAMYELKLNSCTMQQLVEEIEKRGFKVSLTLKSE